jgi:hypothetical protein
MLPCALGIRLRWQTISIAMRAAFAMMLSAVRRGGVAVIHFLNVWRLPEGSIVWQKCLSREIQSRQVQVLKGVHRFGSQGFVDLVLMDPTAAKLLHADSVPFLGLDATQLATIAESAGATAVEFYGGYANEPYSRSESTDLILIARK